MTPPWGKWFKLVGIQDGQVPDLWTVDEPDLMNMMRFPKHRQPSKISDYNGLIAYAVGKQKIFAAQRRAGAIRIQDPYGAPGSVTYRWPHEMDTETFAWVPDLRSAPRPDDAVPGFMAKYGKQFWNGSHWRITDEEFDALQDAIIAAGEGARVPVPPFYTKSGGGA